LPRAPGYTKAMATDQPGIGNRIAPPRFLAFCLVALVAVPTAIALTDWARGVMIGFDIAAAVFLAVVLPLLRNDDADEMRKASKQNDANRAMLLAITAVTTIAVLAAVAAELGARGGPGAATLTLVVATLLLSWTFGNAVFALHYAHLYYLAKDDGGLDFPGADEPEYWDFVYFAFTLGMTFQTSDTAVVTTRMRKVAIAHSMIAFVFNLGVVAFTINVLGGG
jgi:uncharacterized membrane protein